MEMAPLNRERMSGDKPSSLEGGRSAAITTLRFRSVKAFTVCRNSPAVMRPQGKRYPEFLIDEVMPFLYERYRIARGPENTGIGGSSLGALIALFTVLDRPGIFGRLLLESPSLFISNRRLLKYSHVFRGWPEKIYLAMGTHESGREDRDKQVVEDVR